ncbi:hypothetical protein [Nostoc sp.]
MGRTSKVSSEPSSIAAKGYKLVAKATLLGRKYPAEVETIRIRTPR